MSRILFSAGGDGVPEVVQRFGGFGAGSTPRVREPEGSRHRDLQFMTEHFLCQ